MTNKIRFTIEKNEDAVTVRSFDMDSSNILSEVKIMANEKSINTKSIYDMLNYSKNNEYIFDSEKIPADEIIGEDKEIKRLYNYTHDLFKQILEAVNNENIIINEQKNE